MATEVIMPKLGMAVSDGTIVKWLKEDGAEVKAGEPIVVVMSKKITYEVQAPAGGILRPVAKPKDVRAIGQVIGFVTAPGEEIPRVEIGMSPPVEVPTEAPVPATPVEAKVEVSAEKPAPAPSSPAARRLARELGVDISKVTPMGRRITEDDVRRYYDEQTPSVASQLARRMAAEEGLDLAQIKGTGPGGRITEEDILRALEKREMPAALAPQRIPFAGMRQAIAEHMVHSLQSTAQVSMNTTADVTELKVTRETLGARWGRKPSYTDLLIKAMVVALKEHPILGAKLEEDEIVLPTEYNIGVAVALEDGLIVPVVRNADKLTLLEIGDRVKDLAQRARENALEVDEVTGGAMTITNLGMFGIDASTPIINPPEVSILGVGRIVQKLALVDGQVVARDVMTLSLTVDHRIVDGAPGAQFLQTLVALLEHPALIFAG
ncbi:MAG: dihydrolipoamide acetyltransferase family protein [Chloroflexota bacterium]|nr:dihydrolipoamide acetyltransferase family protein [Chloroflexota bacterium]